MSQSALEAALGKLICDEDFRKAFFQDAEEAAQVAGFDLTPVELSSLHRIEPGAIQQFAQQLDERVRCLSGSVTSRASQ